MSLYYERSGIQIYHGDCGDVLPGLLKADLVLTDPPYGIGENARRVAGRGKMATPTDYGEFDWDEEPASEELIQMTINAGHKCILWGGNYFNVSPSKAWLVWDKQNTGDFADCELAWTNLDQAVRIFRFMWNGMLRAGEARGVKRVHPTQKPRELMTWCLGFVPEAESVIDPFMGAGGTLCAARLKRMSAIGIEKEERYCEAAANRLEAIEAQPVLFEQQNEYGEQMSL